MTERSCREAPLREAACVFRCARMTADIALADMRAASAVARGMAQLLKAAMIEGPRGREQRLLKDRHGPPLRRSGSAPCMDEIIRSLYEVAAEHLYRSDNPSLFRAHGGGRDRRLWPRAAGAGLRHRSAVPAALQADRLGRERRGSHSLLPVGHGIEGRPRHALGRRMHPPGARRHDDPHRDPGNPLPDRRPAALRRTGRAVRQGGRTGHRGGIRHRQARGARGAAPPRRAVALSGRAERQGRQGRPA